MIVPVGAGAVSAGAAWGVVVVFAAFMFSLVVFIET
jgi:hypothetical protein